MVQRKVIAELQQARQKVSEDLRGDARLVVQYDQAISLIQTWAMNQGVSPDQLVIAPLEAEPDLMELLHREHLMSAVQCDGTGWYVSRYMAVEGEKAGWQRLTGVCSTWQGAVRAALSGEETGTVA